MKSCPKCGEENTDHASNCCNCSSALPKFAHLERLKISAHEKLKEGNVRGALIHLEELTRLNRGDGDAWRLQAACNLDQSHFIKLPECLQRGGIEFTYIHCKSCDGRGICLTCNQTGVCHMCGGSGRCSLCNGTGECVCKGKSDCSICKGSHHCPRCKGEKECVYCNGFGKCGHCRGTSKCGICGGSGKEIKFNKAALPKI